MGRINTILFLSAKIVIIKKIAKFRTYSKIGIPLKIPTCKYNGFKFDVYDNKKFIGKIDCEFMVLFF